MEDKFDNINKQVKNDKAEVVTIDGVEYLRDPSGIILKKPYKDYKFIIDAVYDTLKSNYPELTYYLEGLTPIFTFKFKTFATGYGYVYMNPYFIDALMKTAVEDGKSKYTYVLFVYIHEMYHNLFSHMSDGKRNESEYPDFGRQNIAMDYTINGVIEALYPVLKGATTSIGGYISSKYAGRTWQSVYNELSEKDMKAKGMPYQKIVDAISNVSRGTPNGGGMKTPQNNEYSFSDDYKDGYQSRYLEIKNIIENAINAGKDIEEIITILEEEAQKKGINVYESYLPYPSQNDSYNKGVRQAYVDSINKLKKILDYSGKSEDQEYQSNGDNKYNDKLKNAVDDLYKQLNSGTPSEPEKDDNDGNEDSSKKHDENSDNTGNTETSGKPGNGTGGDGMNPDSMSVSEKERVMKQILDERGMKEKEVNKSEKKTEREIAEDLKNHIDKIRTKNEEDEIIKDRLKKEIDEKYPIAKVKTGIDWKEQLRKYISNSVTTIERHYNIHAIAHTIDFYKQQKFIDSRYKKSKKDDINHIVIGLDNSGSVCSSGSVPDFLGAIVEILDAAMPDNTVIDFIQFDTHIQKCTRVVHKRGESIKEIENVRSATGGGTDYAEVMKECQLLTMDWDKSNPKVGYVEIFDEFKEKTAKGSKGIIKISPAVCSIIFTDTDFYYGRRFEGMNKKMYDKMKFVILNSSDEINAPKEIKKYDTLFINRNVWKYD